MRQCPLVNKAVYVMGWFQAVKLKMQGGHGEREKQKAGTGTGLMSAGITILKGAGMVISSFMCYCYM